MPMVLVNTASRFVTVPGFSADACLALPLPGFASLAFSLLSLPGFSVSHLVFG